jgi:NADH:ubiquinone reductase (H+-translocating)
VQSRRSRLLTVVVAGGRFAGAETVASINDFVRDSLRFYQSLREADVRMVLVLSGPAILPELGDELGRYAQDKIAMRGVDVRTNACLRWMQAP